MARHLACSLAGIRLELAGTAGLEPATRALTATPLYRLSYIPKLLPGYPPGLADGPWRRHPQVAKTPQSSGRGGFPLYWLQELRMHRYPWLVYAAPREGKGYTRV